MELVVDANIIVAGFLRSAKTRQLLFHERLRLLAPEYTLTEAERVLTSQRLRKRLGGLSPAQVRFLLSQLTAGRSSDDQLTSCLFVFHESPPVSKNKKPAAKSGFANLVLAECSRWAARRQKSPTPTDYFSDPYKK